VVDIREWLQETYWLLQEGSGGKKRFYRFTRSAFDKRGEETNTRVAAGFRRLAKKRAIYKEKKNNTIVVHRWENPSTSLDFFKNLHRNPVTGFDPYSVRFAVKGKKRNLFKTPYAVPDRFGLDNPPKYLRDYIEGDRVNVRIRRAAYAALPYRVRQYRVPIGKYWKGNDPKNEVVYDLPAHLRRRYVGVPRQRIDKQNVQASRLASQKQYLKKQALIKKLPPSVRHKRALQIQKQTVQNQLYSRYGSRQRLDAKKQSYALRQRYARKEPIPP